METSVASSSMTLPPLMVTLVTLSMVMSVPLEIPDGLNTLASGVASRTTLLLAEMSTTPLALMVLASRLTVADDVTSQSMSDTDEPTVSVTPALAPRVTLVAVSTALAMFSVALGAALSVAPDISCAASATRVRSLAPAKMSSPTVMLSARTTREKSKSKAPSNSKMSAPPERSMVSVPPALTVSTSLKVDASVARLDRVSVVPESTMRQ